MIVLLFEPSQPLRPIICILKLKGRLRNPAQITSPYLRAAPIYDQNSENNIILNVLYYINYKIDIITQ
jgi:hypothetical protein